MKLLVALLAAALFCGGCHDCRNRQDPDKRYEKVLILYQAGFNTLDTTLLGDLNELKRGDLPSVNDNAAILIVGHHTVSHCDYDIKTQPCIIRLYKDKKGRPVMDTLVRLGEDDLLIKKEVMAQSLNYIAEEYKSNHYGLILSSHGTGWLPLDYYAHPSKYRTAGGGNGLRTAPHAVTPPGSVPYEAPENPLPGPPVRTFGEERSKSGSFISVYEMDIKDLADALPYHFDYILMDVCLMGCVEVAYELKDCCRYLGFSPTEVIAAGLDYSKVAVKLLKSGDPDLQGVMDDYYECYASKASSELRSASFTLVDCSKLDALATACKLAFAEWRGAIARVDPDKVQPLFRGDSHWFYDLKDILDKSGAGSYAVDRALEDCIVHKVHTEKFMPAFGGFVFNTFCGLSMYLPCDGSAYLDRYYKSLAWNKETLLVL